MRIWTFVTIISAAMLLNGCGRKIVVYQYPDFWEHDMNISSVAVWPFRNQTDHQGAGQITADKLASALTANGTYTVYNASDLGAVEGARDLQLLAGDIEAATSAGREFGRADAVITGTVTSFQGSTKRETRFNSVPIYRTDSAGKMYVAGYNNVPYQFTRHDAIVECTATLIGLREGRVLHSAHGVGAAYAQGQTPERDVNGCIVAACNQMIAHMVEQFAIVRKEIKLGSDAMKTAAGLYDNRWDFEKTFPADGEKMLVVVKLPPQCDQNRFRIVIVRKNQREELVSQEIEWDKKFPPIGQSYAFSPAEIASGGGGPGKYTVKFYSGPEPVLTRDVTLK